MIISRTPYRVSLFGGGTDYPDYFTHAERGGAVVGFALNRYCYITVRYLPPYFQHKYRIVYSRIELVNKLEEIKHSAVREVLKHFECNHGLEIHHDGDVPAMSGLGSSSAFTVGLIKAIAALQQLHFSAVDLAYAAINIEQNKIGEAVGCQDQCFAAVGGFTRFDFDNQGKVTIKEFIDPKRLLDHIMLFFTLHQRHASVIAESVIKNMPQRQAQLNRLRFMVDDFVALLKEECYDDIGELFHESWQLKKELSSIVSNDYIDIIYEAAKDAGALGGKLLGAGGGGFMLLFVDPSKQEKIRQAILKKNPGLIEVVPGISNEGSKIVVYEPNGF